MSLRRSSLLAFAAATVPFAIASHLASEVAALGEGTLAAVVFAPRHLYFVALGLAALLALRFIGRKVEGRQRAERVEELLQALPFGGRGVRFAALTFLVQLAFVAATQFVEGGPVCGGDVVAGLVAAFLAAAIGSVLLALCERRFIAFALLGTWVGAKPSTAPPIHASRAKVARFAGRRGAFLFSIACRPPPAAAAL